MTDELAQRRRHNQMLIDRVQGVPAVETGAASDDDPNAPAPTGDSAGKLDPVNYDFDADGAAKWLLEYAHDLRERDGYPKVAEAMERCVVALRQPPQPTGDVMRGVGELPDQLRAIALHDGHSSDWWVNSCTTIHKAAEELERLEFEGQRADLARHRLGAKWKEATAELDRANSRLGKRSGKPVQWVSHRGHPPDCTLLEKSDYEGGDPSLELVKRPDDAFDLVIYKAANDLTVHAVSADAVREAAFRILDLVPLTGANK